MGLHTLGHEVIDAEDVPDGTGTQCFSSAGFLSIHDVTDLTESSHTGRIPNAMAHGGRDFVIVQDLRSIREDCKGGRCGSGSTDIVRNILVKRKTVTVDFFSQCSCSRFDEQAVQIVHGSGTGDSTEFNINGSQLVKSHFHRFFFYVLSGNTGSSIKVRCGQDYRFADLDGRAFSDFVSIGIILVDKVREHQVLDQAGKSLTSDVLDGKKFISHF